ncbi:MAG TPA: hypothetical protein VJN50_01450 [Actinomycetota bacterium]|nr:hypothetical protein [Actinomycetota bacterium]
MTRRVVPLVATLLLLGFSGPDALGSGASRPRAQRAMRPTNLSIVAEDVLAAAKERGGASTTRSPSVPPRFSPRVPVVDSGFDAISKYQYSPADPTGAIGDSFYVTAVNTWAAVYKPNGTPHGNFTPPLRLKTEIKPGGFEFPGGTIDFDPKIVYDPYDDHFVLVYLAVHDASKRSWIVVATIPDATAPKKGTWCIKKFAGDQVDDSKVSWADYPLLGFTSNRVTISTNQFGFGSFPYHYAQILSFPKSKLYNCEGVTPKVFAGDEVENPDGSKSFTVQPAVTNGTGAASKVQYLLSFEYFGGWGHKLVLWRLKVVNGRLKLANEAFKVGTAFTAPSGTQCGGSRSNPNTRWDTGDLRLVNAFFDVDLGNVYAAHAVESDIGGGYLESSARWYEVDVANTLGNSMVERGIVGQSRLDLGWPVVATDSLGNLLMAVSGASGPDDVCLSAYGVDINTNTDAFGFAQVSAGEARYEWGVGEERWGDYNAISRDPADGTRMAMVNAIAKSDGAGSTFTFQQVVDVVAVI